MICLRRVTILAQPAGVQHGMRLEDGHGGREFVWHQFWDLSITGCPRESTAIR